VPSPTDKSFSRCHYQAINKAFSPLCLANAGAFRFALLKLPPLSGNGRCLPCSGVTTQHAQDALGLELGVNEFEPEGNRRNKPARSSS